MSDWSYTSVNIFRLYNLRLNVSFIRRTTERIARVEYRAKYKMMGRIEYGTTFRTEPCLDGCLAKSLYFVEFKEWPGTLIVGR